MLCCWSAAQVCRNVRAGVRAGCVLPCSCVFCRAPVLPCSCVLPCGSSRWSLWRIFGPRSVWRILGGPRFGGFLGVLVLWRIFGGRSLVTDLGGALPGDHRSTAQHSGARHNTQEHCRTHRRTAEHTEHEGARQKTQEHGRIHRSTTEHTEHAGARQKTQEHGRIHRSTAEHTEHTGVRQKTQEHGRAHRSTAEHTGTRQNTQEHCRRFSEDVSSESAFFSMRGDTSTSPS